MANNEAGMTDEVIEQEIVEAARALGKTASKLPLDAGRITTALVLVAAERAASASAMHGHADAEVAVAALVATLSDQFWLRRATAQDELRRNTGHA